MILVKTLQQSSNIRILSKMKAFVLAVIFSVALCACFHGALSDPLVACPSEVSKDCPYPQGQFPVYFSHPEDCSKFCECGMEGIAWAVSCMPGLLWNEMLQTCDWAVNVQCGDRPRP